MASRRPAQETVTLQLGRIPAIGFQVRRFCHYAYPAVIKNDVFTPEGEPNPNLLYLTCPYLRKEAARLEDAGFIAELEGVIAADPQLLSDLQAAQAAHRREWAAAALASSNALDKFPPPNIAAAGDETKIKCLHAHLAWFMTHSDYQVGRLVAQQFPQLWCPDERCARLAES